MIYLFLAIICSSSIALIFKVSEGNNLDRFVVTTANYFTAFIISLFFIINKKIRFFDFTGANFNKNFREVVLKGKGLFDIQASQVWATIVGMMAGIFFFAAFIYYQKSVRENGAGLAGTFGKLGILIPMLFAIVIWQEYPTSWQWVGIILALLSIILVNFPFNRSLKEALRLNLILLFAYGGIAEFSNKIFQKYAMTDYKVLFLFWVFFSAFLISLFYTIKRLDTFPDYKEIAAGILVGIPNLFSSFFLISALNYLKTAVVFPIFSAGSIVLIVIAGYLIFDERMESREIASVVMTIIALILVNL
ncbi:MAG: EamA family transporter [Halanaerobiales bacterium]